MGNKAFLSILAYYNYDASIFDNLNLPDNIDRQTVIDNILMDNAQLDLLYTNFDFMKYAIGSWSKSEYDIWDKLNKAFNEEYNPLWNVDENTTETRTIERDRDVNNTDNQTIDRTITNDETSANTIENTGTSEVAQTGTDNHALSNTQTNSVKGFNNDDWAEHDKSVSSGSDNRTVNLNDTTTNNLTEAQNGTLNNTTDEDASIQNVGKVEEDEKITDTFIRSRGGNIGVTMSQQLLEAELKVRPKLNIYKYISDSFKKKFCLCIY